MPITIHKSKFIDLIKEAYIPILNRQVEEGTIADSTDKNTIYVDLCRELIDEIEWMFRYTSDGETWSHVENLVANNPFPSFLSLDTVASENVSNFLYERAERYFKQNQIRTSELDWFFLDFTVVVGFRVLFKDLNEKDFKTAYPSLSKAINDYDGSNFLAFFKYVIISIVKNTILLGLVFFLLLFASEGYIWLGLLGGGLLVWKLYGWYSQSKLYSKLKNNSLEKFTQYNAMYSLFSDGYVRWDLLDFDIKRLRNLSIQFPLVLDTAVTDRKNNS
jgi:hypothetical protein